MTAQIATIQIEEAYHFTVEEYEKILETGIFDDERVELLNGIIRVMSPISDKHRGIVARVLRLLNNIRSLRDYFYSPQSSITLQDDSAPQPDVLIAKAEDSDYMDVPLLPQDVFLVIEIADSSLRIDRKVKTTLYAGSGIQEYWIVNLQDHQIEVFKQPENADYQIKTIAKAGETVTCETMGFMLSVDEVFKGLKKT